MKFVTLGSQTTHDLFVFGVYQILKPNNFRSEPHY
jgi:hypothetical protein